MQSAAACTPGSLLHPTFSAAPFFNLDERSQQAVVQEYEPIGGGPDDAGAGTVLGGFNRNATSEAYLDGESWRGGTTSGSAVGIHSTPRVSYYFAKGVGEYHFGERHPMKPHRLTLTNHLVIGYGLHRQMDMYQPRPATKDELEMFHDQDYVDFLARVTPDNVRHFTSVLSRFNIGDDCPIFSDMYTYCQRYAGASLMAARKLVAGSTDIAINWTGGLHHAKKSEASGFCYVNDIVLAILELLRTHPRVLYIDIDIHHGDGVQEAFYNTNRVLTVSFHKYSPDFFPGTGHIDELGHALGKNFSLNVPLQDGIDNESYVALFKSIMEPTIQTYRPSAIVLQCGADSLGADRLGCFNLSIAAHGECVRFIKSFALPMIVLGGGGYTIKNVSRCWTYETAVLLGQEQDLPNALPHTPYDDFFAPDWKLHPELAAGRNRLENCNSRESLERIRVAVLERVRYMHGAPGVQMNEVPPSLASWIADEDQLEEEGEGDEGASSSRMRDPVAPDYFGGSAGSTAPPPPPSNRAARPRITGPISGGGGPPAPKKRRKASVTAAAAASATEPTSAVSSVEVKRRSSVGGEGAGVVARDRDRPRMDPGGEEDNE